MNIIYFDVDSLRPDHLGCYGYHRETSPIIDGIAAQGMRFDNVYASDVPCHPSRTALWSGRHGIRTGVVDHGGTASEPFREGPSRVWAGTFYEDGWMRALRGLDFYTATISSFGERHGCWHWYAGFNEIINPGKVGMESAEEITPLTLEWLKRNGSRGNWFLHVNLWDAHTPYRAPASFGDPFADRPLPNWMTKEVFEACYSGFGPHCPQEPSGYTENASTKYPRAPSRIDSMQKVEAWFNGYDTGIRYADHHIGLILKALGDMHLLDKTIVVVSADHGENQGELNVWGDHQTADQFTCNVPLIIRWPSNPNLKGVNRGLHYHFDWAATIVDMLGGAVSSAWDGRSFAEDLAAGRDGGRDHLVLSQGAWSVQRSVRFRRDGGDWLMIRTLHDGYKNFEPYELYELTSDPHEQRNLASAKREIVAEASRLLDGWWSDSVARSGVDVDPLMTVLREGGPYHCRGRLAAYLDRLEATGRPQHAARLRSRHPQQEKSENSIFKILG
ncbi:sulfatase [Bradyrhizobium sp. WSM3983]|uniref:sulfatase n=1 Tax=Bradyrhizobium sp. WSM3983 TaxID=1038867 RepID=UPI00041BE450|nr:sulfatase [Bradyrhizobium sp. WSM3983]